MSRMFAASGKEAEWLASKTDISHSVGRFLQKTNIIRDFREDVDDRRFFWPREIWTREKYGRGPDGSVFKEMQEMYEPGNQRRALWVQSGMIVDALRHAEDALQCLLFLRNQSIIQSNAIPITLCIATLASCFMNPEVFHRKVKVRKAEAASVRSVSLGGNSHPIYCSPLQIMMRCNSPREVAYMFRDYARKIRAKALPEDPNYHDILSACDKVSQIPLFTLVHCSDPFFRSKHGVIADTPSSYLPLPWRTPTGRRARDPLPLPTVAVIPHREGG
jgi:farnesyl-diphosphate farnesyltransferase